MIFVMTGSQEFSFDRLLKEVDRLTGEKFINETVFAQTGCSDYKPKNFGFARYINNKEFEEKIRMSRIIVTHAGTGNIITALRMRKKVIAVPRYAKYGEHVDDHQLQIVERFAEMGVIEPCYQVEDLEQALKNVMEKEYRPYESNTDNFVRDIENYLESVNFD